MKLVALALAFPLALSAAIVPADRLAQWDYAGVVGGIPDSSTMTVFSNFSAGASAAQINAAITACPSNQVITLGAGVFNLSTAINMKAGVVLRGAGMTSTILTNGGIQMGAYLLYDGIKNGNWNGGGTATWTSGYAQGTSNITVSSVSGLAVGSILGLDQLADGYYINQHGYEGAQSIGRGNNRALQQLSRVTDISGTNVTIWPPLAANFWSSGLTPQAFWLGSGWLRRSGIEDLTFDGTGFAGIGSYEANIMWETVENCWLLRVKSIKPSARHIALWGAINCEVRQCFFYDTQNAASQSYGVNTIHTGWLLVEDNIFEKVVSPYLLTDCTHGTVCAYNYTTNNYYTAAGHLMGSYVGHNSHTYANLIEGNFFWGKATSDFVWGSSSHGYIFRNGLTGYAPYTYGGGESTESVNCIFLDITNRAWSSVGNLLGTASEYDYYESTPMLVQNDRAIYRIGTVNTAYGTGWPSDTNTFSTFYRHMDYNTYSNAIVYNATNADVTLPESYIHDSKPSYFGILTWPPYNPTNTSAAQMSYTNIPAGYRAAFGTNPPAESGGGGSSGNRSATVSGTFRAY